jgi:hypothetical protein
MANRYKGRIRHWELWNEVNDRHRFYSGSIETMVEMARIAHGELKAADPGNFVLSPNFTGPFRETLDVLDRYLAAGGGRYADGLAYHFYLLEGRKPETLRDYVAGIRKVLDKHGLRDLPIWNTESGLRNENSDGAPEDMKLNDKVWPKLSADVAAARTARSLIVGWMVGMQRFYWYSWDHTSYGLMEQSTKRPKPAAIAYGEVNRWMTGSVVRGCQIVDEVWSCELENASGRKAWMVWHAGERAGQVQIAAAQSVVEAHDLKGDIAAIPTGTRARAVDGSPVLLAQHGFLAPR